MTAENSNLLILQCYYLFTRHYTRTNFSPKCLHPFHSEYTIFYCNQIQFAFYNAHDDTLWNLNTQIFVFCTYVYVLNYQWALAWELEKNVYAALFVFGIVLFSRWPTPWARVVGALLPPLRTSREDCCCWGPNHLFEQTANERPREGLYDIIYLFILYCDFDFKKLRVHSCLVLYYTGAEYCFVQGQQYRIFRFPNLS